MIKDYIKEFDTNSEYQSYIAGDPVLPNVSYIVETNGVEFKPYVPPQPITYTASEKLTKTWSNETTTFGATIKSHTFENGVGTIEFNNDVTTIGDDAFRACKGLTSVTIPDSVTSIGNNAFNYCSGLTSITIPDGVTSIGEGAFSACEGLTSVTIPDSVTSIGLGAFSNSTGLTSVTIPNNVISIGGFAFSACKGLTSVTIPDSVTSIGESAFGSCSGLTSVTCNATTAPTIQSTTFQGVKTGGTLTVPSGSTGYDVWMGTGNYYLGQYNWKKVEQ